MKTYQIQKFSGNQNKWGDDFIVLRTTTIDEKIADDFNTLFDTTGIKYVETDIATDEVKSESEISNENDSKPDIEIAKDANGQDIDVTHSEQKDGTATELDHGTVAIANEEGTVITDNATALQDGTNKVENDNQAKSAPAPDADGDLAAK